MSFVLMMNAALTSVLTRAAFMHHDDKGHSTLKHYTALKGFMLFRVYRLLTAHLLLGSLGLRFNFPSM